MKATSRDNILLDDDLEIMVIPHFPGDRKWLTYDDIDEGRAAGIHNLPRWLYRYNALRAFKARARRRAEIYE